MVEFIEALLKDLAVSTKFEVMGQVERRDNNFCTFTVCKGSRSGNCLLGALAQYYEFRARFEIMENKSLEISVTDNCEHLCNPSRGGYVGGQKQKVKLAKIKQFIANCAQTFTQNNSNLLDSPQTVVMSYKL